MTAHPVLGAACFPTTGIQGTHLLDGLILGAIVLMHALNNGYAAEDYSGVEMFGLYWHFVDTVRTVLFSLICFF